MSFIQLEANPDRLIAAVASIGYDPEVALADLLDNSVSAKAKAVNLAIIEHEIDSDDEKVDQYIISDDGVGMDQEGLKKAFNLGSDQTYEPGALGKFGIGLKSAGLSLGNRIKIISKTKQGMHFSAILDRASIKSMNKYGVEIEKSDKKEIEIWNKYVKGEQGSVLIIENLNEGTPDFSGFIPFMKEYLGIIYHRFIEKGLKIFINGEKIIGIDPLFSKEANKNGGLENIEEWDGKTVKWLLEKDTVTLSESPKKISVKVNATQLIHPPSFDDLQNRKREEYLIGTQEYSKQLRHGFYVYRNDRIICLGERFYGLISSAQSYWAFRGSISFTESADELLELDVKKRHIRLPKDTRLRLKNIFNNYITLSRDSWDHRKIELKKAKNEMPIEQSARSLGTTPIANSDYSPYMGEETNNPEIRLEKQKNLAEETMSEIKDAKAKESLPGDAERKQVITFSDGLKGNILWKPYPSTKENVIQAILNRSNSWVSTAYNSAEGEKNNLSIELLNSLFFILAKADSEIITAFNDIDEEIVKKVMSRFRKIAGSIAEVQADHLENRINDNNLFENEM